MSSSTAKYFCMIKWKSQSWGENGLGSIRFQGRELTYLGCYTCFSLLPFNIMLTWNQSPDFTFVLHFLYCAGFLCCGSSAGYILCSSVMIRRFEFLRWHGPWCPLRISWGACVPGGVIGASEHPCTCIGLNYNGQVHHSEGILLAFHPPNSFQVWARVRCNTLC